MNDSREYSNANISAAAGDSNGQVYAFEDFELYTGHCELVRSGRTTSLQLKPTQLLLYLIQNHERIVSKDEMLRMIWPQSYISDSTFSTAIAQIRQVLDDDGNTQRLIRTSRGRGYRFVGELECHDFGFEQTATNQPRPEISHQRKFRLAMAGGLALLLLIAVAVFWTRPLPDPGQVLGFEERDWVLISGFENRTGEARFDNTLEHALKHTLVNSKFVNVVPQERIRDMLKLMKLPLDARVDAALGNEISLRDGGISALLTGRIQKFGSTYVLGVEVWDLAKDALVASLSEEALGEDQIWAAVRRLASSVRETLGEELALIRQSESKLVKVTTPSLRALKLYSEADSVIATGTPGNQIAEELLKQAIAEDPQFASAYIHLAHALRNQLIPQEATVSARPIDDYLSYASKAFELADQLPDRERYFIRGSYFEMVGETEQALVSYRALLQLHPDHYWAVNNIAIILRRSKRYDEAATPLIKLAQLRPTSFITNYRAYYWLTSTDGDLDEAALFRQRAIRLIGQAEQETHPLQVAGLQLGTSIRHWLEGDLVAMQTEIERWTSIYRTASGRYQSALGIHLGLAHSVLGQRRKAEDYFEKAAKIWPINYQQHLYINAWTNGETGQIPEIVKAWPSNHRAGIFAAMGLVREARELIEDAEANRARNNGISFDVPRGLVAYLGGRTEDAILLLQSGIERQPCGYPIYHTNEVLAGVWLSRGNVGEALRVLERSASGHPERIGCAIAKSRPSKIPERMERVLIGYQNAHAVKRWMRIKLRLAHLYRQSDRETEARQIESEIRSLLAYADDDYWMVRYLQGAGNFLHLPIHGPYDDNRADFEVWGQGKIPSP